MSANGSVQVFDLIDFNLPIYIAILAAFVVVLDRASYAAIKGATEISESTGIGYTSIGFIFVALSTSVPEGVVAYFGTIRGEVGLAIGNVFGSNIANICLILGLPILYGCALKKDPGDCLVNLDKKVVSGLFFGLFVSSVLPLVLVRNVRYGPYVGIALISFALVHYYYFSRSEAAESPRNQLTAEARKVLVKGILRTLVGVAGVVAGAYAIVYAASNLATALAISGELVGATIVAVGTSLPELSVSLKAVQKKRLDLALGNAIGSCFANLTVILGLIFIFSTVTIRVDAYFDLVFFSIISNLVFWFFLSQGRLGSRQALVLLLVYAVFLTEFVGIFTFF